MPRKPRPPCSVPGCPELTPGGSCESGQHDAPHGREMHVRGRYAGGRSAAEECGHDRGEPTGEGGGDCGQERASIESP